MNMKNIGKIIARLVAVLLLLLAYEGSKANPFLMVAFWVILIAGIFGYNFFMSK